MTRKLIKPDLNEIKKFQKKDNKKKPPPAYKTHAENYYYIKQMNNRTPMVIELVDGEVLKGRIEWYDEKCIKFRLDDGSNYILFKHFIKYMYKNPEAVEAEGSDENNPA
jgi:sRNA-binding regulator protein Hfq